MRQKQIYLKTATVKLIFIIGIWCFVECGNPAKEKPIATGKDTLARSAVSISAQIEANPSNAELYYQRAVVYFNEKYLDRSLADIDEAVRLEGSNPLYHYYRGRILYAMNRTMDAEKAYQSAISIKPDYQEAQMKLAELYYIVKQHKQSTDLLNAVIKADPDKSDAHFFKGMNLKEMGDTLKAIAAFQHAVESDKANYDAAMQLGILYTAKKQKYAYDYLTAAIRMQRKNPEAYFARAWYFQEMGEYQKALFDYRKVIDLDPSNDKAYYNVGFINYEVKQYDEALRAWNICVQMNNHNLDAYYMRGLVHEIKGDKRNARMNYTYVLQEDPENRLARERLAKLK